MTHDLTRRTLLRGVAAITAGGALIGLAPPAHAAGRTIYVATNGNDGWTGQHPDPQSDGSGPLRTLLEASERVAEAVAAGLPAGGLEVVVRPGTYHLDATLVLGPEHSGADASRPVVWRSEVPHAAVISGGRVLTGTWTAPGSDGVRSLSVPGSGRFRTLFVDGVRAPLVRYPATGNLYHGGQSPNLILAGLARAGDYVEYTFQAPVSGTYDLWLGVSTGHENSQGWLRLAIDNGAPLTPGTIAKSDDDFRVVKYSRVLTGRSLTAGSHTVRVSNIRTAAEGRVHLDALVFTTNTAMVPPVGEVLPAPVAGEQRVVVDALDYAAGYSSIEFQRIAVTGWDPDNHQTLKAEFARQPWADDPEAFVEVVSGFQYFNERRDISTVNTATGQIQLAAPANGRLEPANPFTVRGVRAELKTAGQWYLSTSAQRLDYLPPAGQDPGTQEFVVPVLDRLVVLAGDGVTGARVRWLTLRDFTFTHCATAESYPEPRVVTDAAIVLDCASNCRIEDCHLTGVDGYGIWLHLDSCDNVVDGNLIDDIGAGGILLTSARIGYGHEYDARSQVQNFAPLRNALTNNTIRDGGRVWLCAAGINLDSRPPSTVYAAGNLVAANLIENMPRQGVFAFRNQGGNIIAYNRIQDVVLSTADAGAINIAIMTNLSAPSLVRHNVIVDAPGMLRLGTGVSRPYGFGLYADHSTSNVWWERNSVTGASLPMLVHAGQFNALVGNEFLNPHQVWFLDTDQHLRDNRMRRNVLSDPSAATQPAVRLYSPVFAFQNLLTANPRAVLESERNVVWSDPAVWFEPGRRTFAAWQALVVDVGSVNAAPGATSYSAVGFQPIDTGNAGPGAVTALPALAGMAAVTTTAAPVVVDAKTTRYSPTFGQAGAYRVYARRSSSTAPQPLRILVEHADGQSMSVYSEWTGTGRNPEYTRFGTYVGTYRFNAGAGHHVTFSQPGTATPVMPSQLVLIRVPQFDTAVADELWDAVTAVGAATLTVGATTPVVTRGLLGDGTLADLTGASISYGSDTPAVATVVAGGPTGHQVDADGAGTTRIWAAVTLNGLTVRSRPITVVVT
ncbi:right-handed parallel beta-helix repeat-containing protein [Jiangella anatolica]|uniref:right-handed parallel beta-helix repeat-containing protein n=1 Tax=Jiangella anatolica TaxID=2670374 RepID=UPI000DA9F225|nr:right-handed parallel beta-helix repeat-containing protein [Jiangella anatolica]